MLLRLGILYLSLPSNEGLISTWQLASINNCFLSSFFVEHFHKKKFNIFFKRTFTTNLSARLVVYCLSKQMAVSWLNVNNWQRKSLLL